MDSNPNKMTMINNIDSKTGSILLLHSRSKPQIKDIHYLRIKVWKQNFEANGCKKQHSVTYPISNKTDFKPQQIEPFMLIKLKIHDDISILNICSLNAKALIFLNISLLNIKYIFNITHQHINTHSYRETSIPHFQK